jgi:RimJ/RimL family protein N-acetyltransferase
MTTTTTFTQTLSIPRMLTERDRRELLMHFLALQQSDRILRFGVETSDELITRYVQRLDFERDTILGVFDSRLSLVGAGHLSFSSRDAFPEIAGATQKERVAEFGVSVLESARCMGVGFKLFKRAAIRCRIENIDTIYMRCLSTNPAMIHIAAKAGMEFHRDPANGNAYLKLSPADPMTILQDAEEEQLAAFDFAMKAMHVQPSTGL